MTLTTSWGRLRRAAHTIVPLPSRRAAPGLIAGSRGLAAGMHRSYGDVSSNGGGTLWDARPLDKFIAFDPDSGVLTCEAGVLLRDIQRVFAPRGWMLAVTPGTAMATVGGAIANDVHGKNHHRQAAFGNHLLALTLARTDGEVIQCTPHGHAEWLHATVGGLGLTGVILDATLQLARVPGAWIDAEDIAFENLGEFFELSRSSEPGWEYGVAWIDVTTDGGRRGIFSRGNMLAGPTAAPAERRPLALPFTPPFSLVNRATLPLFNRAYYLLGRARAGRRAVGYEPFFYPLDAVRDWNRMYGPRGFYQYQCLFPEREAPQATAAMLLEASRARIGSFLGVLKTLGRPPSLGMLSFARPGTTLALDFPARGDETAALFRRFDAIVRDAGGRIYLAKDARMPRDLFEAGYPRLDEFTRYRDPGISSDLSRRLLGS